MHAVCKNCGHHLKSNFCSECGQSAEVHDINVHFFWHDIQHGIFHYDKGLPFTIKELFTRPGHAIRDFIEGKRIKYFKPVGLIVILAGIYTVLFHWLHVDSMLTGLMNLEQEEQRMILKMVDWYTNHYALVTLATVPFSALVTFLAFRKTGYNYLQMVVLVLYVTAARLIIGILSLPFTTMLSTENMFSLSSFMGIVSLGYSIWAFLQFFNKISLERRVLGLLYVLLWYILIFIILLVLVGLIAPHFVR